MSEEKRPQVRLPEWVRKDISTFKFEILQIAEE
jgi:hypothetical protein